MHSYAEYERNNREMLELYQQLSWKEQVKVIGRLSVMVENHRTEERKDSFILSQCEVIPFPAVACETD